MSNVRSSSRWIMRLPLLAMMALVFTALLVGCGDEDEPAPTEIVVITGEPTATSSPTITPTATSTLNETETIAAILESANATATAQQQIIDAQATQLTLATTQQPSVPTVDAAAAATETSLAGLPTPTPSATNTALPSNFPTPQIEQVIVVEQVFEGGRMFWFRESKKIWVVYGSDPVNPSQLVLDPSQGVWLCFDDTFVDGEPEFDPAMEPQEGTGTNSTFPSIYPQAQIQQPIRGFGKLWRDHPELRDHLGWALTGELEYNARRDYLAGGVVQNGTHVRAPGEWRVGSVFNQTYIFLEQELGAACPSGTWRVNQG